MKIKVTKVFIENEKGTEVEFSAEAGRCRALWVGARPKVEDICEIEIEVPYTLQWKKDILSYQGKTFQMKINGDSVSLRGFLDVVEDNFASLKLGNDIILLETEGIPFEEGVFVEVVAEKIIIHDINI